MIEHAATKPIRDISRNGQRSHESMPQLHQRSLWERWFMPHQETQVVAQQSAKGVFLPWPLLAIITTLAIILISGLVTLEVQVANLSTTLLLRDNDHSRQIEELKHENAKSMEDLKHDLAKETERRELTDLKLADLRERQPPRRN